MRHNYRKQILFAALTLGTAAAVWMLCFGWESIFFPARKGSSGHIGTSRMLPLDNPADNLFHVPIDSSLTPFRKAWLWVEVLSGSSQGQLYYSLNDGFAQPVKLEKPQHDTLWQKLRIPLSARGVQPGDNVIRFTAPDSGSYRVRNISMECLPGFAFLSSQEAVPEKHYNSLTKYLPGTPQELSLNGATLFLGDSALSEETNITISTLLERDLMPMNPNLTNVTAGRETLSGYRFLPHGTKFDQPVRLALSYDPQKIPAGYTSHDIQTFYFDEQKHGWVALSRDSVDTEKQLIYSRTEHFTDMINGVISVPEAPQSSAYTPTMISDLKAANPAAGIALIEPPQANNMGGASMSYPIALPPGRNGMQPALSISYNSAGGNGWLGIGWDLSLPAITLETRWGVPRYHPTKESETYLLMGQQLHPVAHRAEWVNRTSGDKRFYPRVEGSFAKIVRHGDSPKSYWWEVTDKSGTKQFYGGLPKEGVVSEAVLTDEQGNIAQWQLVETRDLNQNFVRYHYTIQEAAGIAGSKVLGKELYPKKITYTGHQTQEGLYEVRFIRDRQLNQNLRPDAIISGTLGFKRVTADLLKKIEVEYNGKPIRSYRLTYQQGAFFKNLLIKIEHLDTDGNLFNQHRMEYYDEVREKGEYVPFGKSELWKTHSDNIHGSFASTEADYASALSGTQTKNWGASGSVVVGYPYDGGTTKGGGSAGGNYSYSSSTSYGRLLMIDLNGDGLADKLVKREGRLFYRPQLPTSPGKVPTFGDRVAVSGVRDFLKEESSTHSGGVETNAGYGLASVFGGVSFSGSSSETLVYFSDVNGDGLPDIVDKGNVYFNALNDAGVPTFTRSSSQTDNPIGTGVGASVTPTLPSPKELNELQEKNPMHDVVRLWVAPYKGTVSIDAPVTLLKDSNGTGDGVWAMIQHRQNELWRDSLAGNDFATRQPTGQQLKNLPVKKGDKLFFRLNSAFDGKYDKVHWNPVITYSEHHDTLNDANNLPLYQFHADKDFVLSGPQTIGMPFKGKIKITGTLSKPVLSDRINLSIVSSKKDTIYSASYAWDSVVKQQKMELDLSVDAREDLSFHLDALSSVDWKAVSWQPSLHYTESHDTLIKTVVDRHNDPIYSFVPPVDRQIYKQLFSDSAKRAFPIPWPLRKDSLLTKQGEVLLTDTLRIQPSLSLDTATIRTVLKLFRLFGMNAEAERWLDSVATGTITFSLKQQGRLLHQQTILVNEEFVQKMLAGDQDSIRAMLPDTTLIRLTQEKVHASFHTLNQALARLIRKPKVYLYYGDKNDSLEHVQVAIPQVPSIFGNLYRGWGHFAYNSQEGRKNAPIDTSKLKIDLPKSQKKIDLGTDPDQMQSNFDDQGGKSPNKTIFTPLLATKQGDRWIGYDPYVFLVADTMSASRMGLKSLIPTATPAGGNARMVIKRSKTSNDGWSAGASLVFGYSKAKSSGSSTVLTDVADMNGDRYPDILSGGQIQYTNHLGELTSLKVAHGASEAGTTSNTESESSTGSGGFPAMDKEASNSSKQVFFKIKATGSVGVSDGEGTSNTAVSWVDINGDGLPDRVHEGGKVALNVGYRFLPPEPWGYQKVQKGTNINGSASIGGGGGISGAQKITETTKTSPTNIDNASIVAGVGFGYSYSFTSEGLHDVNGDGLVDYTRVSSHSRGGVEVRLNTGSGFSTQWEPWTQAGFMAVSTSLNESANAAFSIGFPLVPPIPLFKLVVTIGGNLSRDFNREQQKIMDVDGDGLPDYLISLKEDKLYVQRSTIGKTNLLKTVHRPLGGSFSIAYQRKGNSYKMPHSRWVMSSLTLRDGVPGDGANEMLTSYEYDHGYYDRYERDFFGFATVREKQRDTENKNSTYRIVTRKFANDSFFRKGLLLSERLTDGAGNPYSSTGNSYTFFPVEGTDGKARFPALTKTTKLFYEGQAVARKSTSTKYTYDRYGNVLSYHDQGDLGEADDYITTITYHEETTPYIVGIPSTMEVKGKDGTLYRKRETAIDAQGNIVRILQYLSSQVSAQVDIAYDSYGNMSRITYPPNHRGQRMFYRYSYDPDNHSYLTEVSDAFGYRSQTAYDFRFGLPTKTTSINGQELHYRYDAKGRIDKVIGPKELAAGVPFTIEQEYHPNDSIPWALTRHYDSFHPNNYIETAIFADGLGRVLQTKKDAALFQGKNQPDEEVMSVSGQVIYDAFGRAVKAYYPVTEPKGTTKTLNQKANIRLVATTHYDPLNRETLKVFLDSSKLSVAYGFGTDRAGKVQFRQLTTDPNGNTTETFTNLRGVETARLARGELWTSQTYNPINELLSVTDAENNKTSYTYDKLGRVTSVNHPDRGLTQTTYDLSGNKLTHMTANLRAADKQPITYRYDYQRLTTITYPSFERETVRYRYGAAGAAHNRAGRLLSVEDITGKQEFFYGNMGETVKVRRTIAIPRDSDMVFTTSWRYDSWNRTLSMTYPDGEQVNYSYNVAGKVRSVEGKKGIHDYPYIRQIGYNEFEEKSYVAYGNGTETHYRYEDTFRRLEAMQSATSSGRKMMDNRYVYDKVGNILSLTNRAPQATGEQKGGPSVYQYTYDKFYRLTAATGSYTGRKDQHSYQLQMRYGKTYQILHKDLAHWIDKIPQAQNTYQMDYGYSSSKPHAATQIGDDSYQYDPNGNVVLRTSKEGTERRWTWDDADRLRSVEDEQRATHFYYDASGERVIKSRGNSRVVYVNGKQLAKSGIYENFTIYVNPYLVVDRVSHTQNRYKYTKYIYTGSERVVAQLGEGFSTRGFEEDPDQYEGMQFFYHPDHLGSTSYLTDRTGEVYQHVEYFPFGSIMVEERHWTVNNQYLFNGKELDQETGLYYYGARYYDPKTSVFISVDPLAEMYPEKTPYHFCSNNPLNRIDPTGLTDFTLNKRTGEVSQVGETNDEPDRVLRTYSMGKNKGEIKYKKNGDAKVAFGGIEQGILKDGQNWKTENNVIAVGGEGQPSVEGVEDFSLKLSGYVGTEIGGAHFTKEGSTETTHMTVGMYKNNSLKETQGHGHVEGIRQGLKLKELKSFYHTHPSINISESDRTRASDADKKSRDRALKHLPHMRFFIITDPLYYGAGNEKIDYTTH